MLRCLSRVIDERPCILPMEENSKGLRGLGGYNYGRGV